MIYCAEKLLKETNLAIRDYASAHKDDASFWRDIQIFRDCSLQTLSLDSDAAFFSEINSVLNVVTTIIVHPHIVNERETIIIRAEQAHGLTPDMFLDTVHDQKLWKDKHGVMTPQEVYYFQNVDELKNYENRFIVHLLDKIGGQLSDYQNFYDYLLGKVAADDSLVEVGSRLETLILRLETLSKKLRRIKNTYFYREVSKANTVFTRVEATNVLKHNRAYNFCFRFYVRNITYGDERARATDLANYYFTRLLLALGECGFTPVLPEEPEPEPEPEPWSKRFRARGFVLDLKGARVPESLLVSVFDKTTSRTRRYRSLNDPDDAPFNHLAGIQAETGPECVVRPMRFESEDFVLDVENAPEYEGFFVTVTNKTLGEGAVSRNLLLYDGTVDFETVRKNAKGYPAEVTADAVSLWDLAYADGDVSVQSAGSMTETELLVRYVKEKTRLTPASRSIYETHCPVCGSRDLLAEDGRVRCNRCGSVYAFAGDGLWLMKLRK